MLNHEPKSENQPEGGPTGSPPEFQCSTTSRRAKTRTALYSLTWVCVSVLNHEPKSENQ